MIKKLLIILIALLFPSLALAVTGTSARFDWSYGTPKVIDDVSATCTDTSTVRYEWVLGQPAQVFDATATCTAAVVASGGADEGLIWFESD